MDQLSWSEKAFRLDDAILVRAWTVYEDIAKATIFIQVVKTLFLWFVFRRRSETLPCFWNVDTV